MRVALVILLIVLVTAPSTRCPGGEASAKRPNIILCMTDDQGWSDTGYNGHPVLKTPNLDAMAAAGLRFDRFYAGHANCSPTRGSCLTGRHPTRYHAFSWGHDLPLREVTIAELVRPAGYATGHFGKWHLGGIPDAIGGTGRGVPESADPQPRHPGNQGFQEWFSCGNYFDLDPGTLHHNGQPAGPQRGDSADIITDRALPWIRAQAQQGTPFLAVIWFPSPHNPHRALPADAAPYAEQGKLADYYGELAAVDRAVGRLRAELRTLGIAADTMLWFNSDNGGTNAAATRGLRGRKTQILEGGIRVPGLLEWPARITTPRRTAVPASTLDFVPTIAALLGLAAPGQPQPIDGVDLLPLIDGAVAARPQPIPFCLRTVQGIEADALIDNRWKLLRTHGRAGAAAKAELYDLDADQAEASDVAAAHPQVVARLTAALDAWQASVTASMAEYPSAGKGGKPAPEKE